MADVRVESADGIATVTLDRPDALNSLTVPLKEALIAAFAALARDGAVRAVILTGEGRAFCAGQDLRERLEPDAAPLDVELRERYNPLVRAIHDLPKPVVAAVNGVAAGAGASLAFACDLRIAADTARFVLAFGQVGLIPDSGATWTLQRLVGASKAAEIALLPDALSAADAERFGLVSRVVPAADLADEARALAGRLAALSPGAVARTKHALRAAAESTFDDALELEARLQGEAGAHPDHAEGIAAFMEKRPPRFGA
ncbi:MAG TPA: enoyl-CoA hydratase-related protein [Candidatus Limnocylindrales bacterium]|nr:enoyl-CoA hydratase-related protein [Candidatus Limnocylindrales bacterium]